jgi:hypothetical protein
VNRALLPQLWDSSGEDAGVVRPRRIAGDEPRVLIDTGVAAYAKPTDAGQPWRSEVMRTAGPNPQSS